MPCIKEPLRLLVAESETAEQRERRRRSAGRSSGETYTAALLGLAPAARCDLVRPAEEGAQVPAALDCYDAVLLSGSPLHMYEDSPEVRRQLAFMRAVFAAGTPSFGSCAGLQVAVAAAGGRVRENKRGHESGLARRITPTEAGRTHPLLRGRPPAFDALTLHSDEVEALPDGALHLATNGVTPIQAAEVRLGPGVFWGVQYHPEVPLRELAASLRRQADDVVEQGLARDRTVVDAQAALLDGLDEAPDRRDLAWQLGVDAQVTDAEKRQAELRNFLRHLVLPTRSGRGRG